MVEKDCIHAYFHHHHVVVYNLVIFIAGLWFLYLIVYSYFWSIGLPIGANFAGMVELVGSAPLFYFCMLLAPVAALLTDVVFITVQTTLFPDETDRARAKEKGKLGKGGRQTPQYEMF